MRTYSQAAKNEVQEQRRRGGKCYDATPDLGTGCTHCAEGWQYIAFIVGGPFDSPQQSRPKATAYSVDGQHYLANVRAYACPVCGVATDRKVKQDEMEVVWS
ncbi:MAG: hypothetical protein KDK05_10470 [Candidatus Competibacteraceae bacterium]|nr:hypothetical protein [Candidatus Competibacteraceae bacterium]